MKKSSVFVSVLGAVALGLSSAVIADNHEEAPPELTDVWIIAPKAGMDGEFAAAVEGFMAERAKMDDVANWQAYTVAFGDKIGPVQFRSCCYNWADLDAMANSENEAKMNEYWNENVDQYVDHYHHKLERVDWENSHWPDGEGDGPYYGATTWTVTNPSGGKSGIARRKMSKVAKENGWDYNWLWIIGETGAQTTTVVSSYANYADMEPPETTFYEFMVEQLGEEEAGQMFQDFSSAYSGTDYTIWKHNPAMSTPEDD